MTEASTRWAGPSPFLADKRPNDKTAWLKQINSPSLEKKVMDIKLTHLITMLQTGYTTVEVRYHGKLAGSQPYTYKAISNTLAMGDTVVVPVDYDGMEVLKLAKVVRVHDAPQVDVSLPYALKWIVQKVDRTAYDEQVAREQAALDALETGKRAAAQATAVDQLQTLVGPARAAAVLAALGGGTLPSIPDNGYEAGL